MAPIPQFPNDSTPEVPEYTEAEDAEMLKAAEAELLRKRRQKQADTQMKNPGSKETGAQGT